MALVTVSVVIPTLNEENNIGKLLTDLQNQSLPVKEVIVVDAGSTDQTGKVVEGYGVRVIGAPPPVGAQRQLGVSKSNGDLIILLDADVRLDQDFVRKVVAEFRTRSLDVACPYYLPYPGGLLITPIYLFFDAMFWMFQLLIPSGAGSCIVVTKSLFNQSGGFKENYKFDDIEFIRRASHLGKFRMLAMFVRVSDRRFRKQGGLRTLVDYLALSVFFSLGLFGLINNYPYRFNHYDKNSKTTRAK